MIAKYGDFDAFHTIEIRSESAYPSFRLQTRIYYNEYDIMEFLYSPHFASEKKNPQMVWLGSELTPSGCIFLGH